jgi:hypothetical protein
MLKCLIINGLILISGCINIGVNLEEGRLAERVHNKAFNRVDVTYKDKSLFNMKANSHRDPNLKGDLIRQEYFINFDF